MHPSYLDSKGLVALWREGLLAKKVLEGNTQGYKNHPQLIRFKCSSNPINYINIYLHFIANEAFKRGYNFNQSKLKDVTNFRYNKLEVTDKQILFEFTHLKKKLEIRDPKKYKDIKSIITINTHPLFKKRKGDIESWEII